MKNNNRFFKTLFFALAIVIVSASCKYNKSDTITGKTDLGTKSNDVKTTQQKSDLDLNKKNEFKFLEKIKSENFPKKDSTNFDNYSKENKLTATEIQLLSLDKIIKNKEVVNVYINYSLKLSSRFKTLVVSYENGDSELMTILINYDTNYKIIDSKEIAYDEIAESILRIESAIVANKIIVIESNYSNEEPVLTQTVYTILGNGKITK
jgi:hypothetical protein